MTTTTATTVAVPATDARVEVYIYHLIARRNVDGAAMMRVLKLLGPIVLAVSLVGACQNKKIDNSIMVDPEGPVSFSQDVHPLLTRFCGGAGCHINERTNGVSLSSYEQVVTSTGEQYGEKIVKPGDAQNSPLFDKIGPTPQFGQRMPQGRAPLSSEQIALLKAWINEGALDN